MNTAHTIANLATTLEKIEQIATFRSPIIAEVFRHWSDIARAADGIPDRRDISPMEMTKALPNIWLCDHEAKTSRFRYRLAGEHVIANTDQPVRGRYLDAITDPEAYPRVQAYFLKCVERPAVLHNLGRIYAEQTRVAVGERIMLPYGDGNGTVTGILGATVRQLRDQHVGALNYPADTRLHTYYRIDDGTTEIESAVMT